MIDITKEQLRTFAEAARPLPGRVHVSTLHRWRLRGVCGVKLETAMIGGKRCTSVEALARFSAAVTAARDGDERSAAAMVAPREGEEPSAAATVRTPSQRQQAIDRAQRELHEAGI